MQSKKFIVQFLVLLFGFLGIAYWIQNKWSKPDDDLSLFFTYGFNLAFTLPVILIIILLFEFLKRYIGFIFMLLGFLKILFFLTYVKVYGLEVNRDNFLLFFVPYGACLIVELLVLSRYLNKADF